MDRIAHERIAVRVEEDKHIRFYFNEYCTPSWGTCDLLFSNTGEVTLMLQNEFADRELTYGQVVIVAKELGVDMSTLNVTIIAKEGIRSLSQPVALPLMIEDLRCLCDFVNTYFVGLAVVHLGVEAHACYTGGGHVNVDGSLSQRIPYKLLTELEIRARIERTNKTQLL